MRVSPKIKIVACAIVPLLLIEASLLLHTPFVRSIQILSWSAFCIGLWFLAQLWPRSRPFVAPLGLAGLTFGILDAAIRGFLFFQYDATAESSFVIESLANTHLNEAIGFIRNDIGEILIWSAVFIVLTTYCLLVFLRLQPIASLTKKTAGLTAAALMLPLVAVLFLPTGPRHLPPSEWSLLYSRVQHFKTHWQQAQARHEAQKKVAEAAITSVSAHPMTIVLVIGESLSPRNMSFYGYSRQTTPRLERLKRKENFYALTPALSVKASTVAAFESMFNFQALPNSNALDGNLFAFFRAAGWDITWISNQDDLGIRSAFASWANRAVYINKIPGRSSSSMDKALLPELQTALGSPAPRKLIVLHLIGAHPHFSLRHPSDLKPLWNESDEVIARLKQKGRSPRVIQRRNHYDLAMLYQDEVITDTLRLSELDKNPTLWLFISDHGMETGDTLSRAGHSHSTLSGFEIPVFLWTDIPDLFKHLPQNANKGFRGDYLDNLLLGAAGIRYKNENFAHSPLEGNYHFEIFDGWPTEPKN